MKSKSKCIFTCLCLLGAGYLNAQVVISLLSITNPAGVANGQTLTVNGDTRYFTNPITALNQIPTGTDVWTTVSNIVLYYNLVPESNVNVYNSIESGQVKFFAVPGNSLSVSNSPGWGTVVTGTNYFLGTYYLRAPFENIGSGVEKSNAETALVAYLNDTNSAAVIQPASPHFSLILQNAAGRATNMPSLNGLPLAGNVSGATNQTNYYFLPANCLTNNGDTYIRTLGLQLQPGPDWKRLQVFWNSNAIMDTGYITNFSGPSSLTAVCQVTRNSQTNATFTCYALENDATNTPGNPVSKVFANSGIISASSLNTFADPIPCYLQLSDGGILATNGQITVWLDRTKVENSFGLY